MAEILALPFRLSPFGDDRSLRLLHAERRRDISAIRRFRFQTYLRRSNIVIDDGVDVDERGHLFGLLARDEIVACARVLPLPDVAAGINRFDQGVLGPHTAPTEVGRLAVGPQRSALLMLALLGLGARWMVENTCHERFISFCDRRLTPVYERVGAQDLGIELTQPGRPRPYRFMLGRFDVAAEQAITLLNKLSGDKSITSGTVGHPQERSSA